METKTYTTVFSEQQSVFFQLAFIHPGTASGQLETGLPFIVWREENCDMGGGL